MKSDTTQLRNELKAIKKKAIETIKEIMAEHNARTIDFRDCDDCPIIIDGADDCDCYTLDELYLNEAGQIRMDCSSWDDCETVTEKNADVSVLIDVLECLEEHEEFLDFADEDDEEEDDDEEEEDEE